jgi:hypothetical protein
MRHFLSLLAACALVPCLGVNPAFAQPPAPPTAAELSAKAAAEMAAKRDPHVRATEMLQRGTELHDKGQCEQAVPVLEGSWALEKDPTTGTLLGECDIKLARWVPAARALAAVLQDKQEGPERARLDALFKQARAQVGGVTVQTSVDGADVFAGNQIVGRTPLRYEAFVEPGDVLITLKKTSVGEMQQLVHVAKGGSATIHLEPPPVKDDEGTYNEARSRIPVVVLAGVAVVAAGAGLGLRVAGGNQGAAADDALAALTAKTGVKSPCFGGANATVCQGIQDSRSKHDGYLNGSTGLFILAGAALAGSITYAFWPSESSGRDYAVAVVPSVAPGAGGLLVQGTF